MMLLVDCGNTSAKWRLMSGGSAVMPDVREPDTSFGLLRSTLASGTAENTVLHVAVANVSGSQSVESLMAVLGQVCGVEVKVHHAAVEKCFAGLTVAYDDLSQLGVDRWLSMLAAYEQVASSLLLVTVGTATTIDKVALDGSHQGGLIAPGWRLLKESLAKGTENLGVAAHVDLPSGALLGANTADCIRHGVSQMLLSYISSAVHQFGGDCSAKILSGGDAPLVSRSLDASLGVDFTLAENLVLDGLSLYCREKGLQRELRKDNV